MIYRRLIHIGRTIAPTVLPAALALAPVVALAAPPKNAALIRYKPPEDAGDHERPVPIELTVSGQGIDYAVRLRFDRLPWGETCKQRCANTTLFIDTDNDKTSGMQLGDDKPETGADLSITIQGIREYKEKSADVYLRARVRLLSDVTGLDQGDTLAELDHRRDRDRLQSEGQQVFVLVDASNMRLPAGKQLRVIFHPSGEKALEAVATGLGGGADRAGKFLKKQNNSINAVLKGKKATH